jgi:hypothetical protein
MSADSSDPDHDLAEAATDVMIREIEDPELLINAGFELLSAGRKRKFDRKGEDN